MAFRSVALGLALAVLASAPALRAQAVDDATRGAARNLGQEGVEAYQSADYATAHSKLDKAYRTLKVPTLGLWSARAMVKSGKLVEAAERYLEVTRLEVSGGDTKLQREAQAEAEAELDALRAQIPSVVVELEGAEAEQTTISVDGTPLATALVGEKRPINPGKHLVRGQSRGHTVQVEVELAAGETKTAILRFTSAAGAAEAPGVAPPAPATTPGAESPSASGASATRTIGFVVLGVGAAGLAVGAVTGGLALGKKSEIDESPNCADNQCLRSEEDTVNGYSTLRTVSTIGFVGGAVLAATGVVLILTAPKSSEQVALRIGPGSARFEGRF